MKIIRTAQATSLILLLILLYGFISIYSMGGIPQSNLLHLWIFSPAIVGVIFFPYFKESMIEARYPALLNKAKGFLTAITAQFTTLVIVYFMSQEGVTKFLFISPVIFYLGLGMTFLLQKRASKT